MFNQWPADFVNEFRTRNVEKAANKVRNPLTLLSDSDREIYESDYNALGTKKGRQTYLIRRLKNDRETILEYIFLWGPQLADQAAVEEDSGKKQNFSKEAQDCFNTYDELYKLLLENPLKGERGLNQDGEGRTNG